MLLEFPWLATYEEKKEGFSGPVPDPVPNPESSSSTGNPLSAAQEAQEESDLMEIAIMAALDRVRLTIQKMPGATTSNYRTTVLGGKDLYKRTGKPFDA
eukprot:8439378-Lingulodinium_polyedra.AAC.1